MRRDATLQARLRLESRSALLGRMEFSLIGRVGVRAGRVA